eukprot:g20361.t1
MGTGVSAALVNVGAAPGWYDHGRGLRLRQLFGGYRGQDIWAVLRKLKAMDDGHGFLGFDEVQEVLNLKAPSMLFLWDIFSQQKLGRFPAMGEEAAGHGGGHSVVVEDLTTGRRKRIPVGHDGPIQVRTLRGMIADALDEEQGAWQTYGGSLVDDPGRVRLLVDGIEPNLLAFLSEKDRNRHLQVEISEDGIQDELNEAQNEGLGDVREIPLMFFDVGLQVPHRLPDRGLAQSHHERQQTLVRVKHFRG